MNATVRNLVWERAQHRCEYCRMHQQDELLFRFHVEHIIARQHGGTDDESNLALSCHYCNRNKGPNLTAIDPLSSQVVSIFNPRQQRWETHFTYQGASVVGLTAIGRATIRLLKMNDEWRLELRTRLIG